MHCKEQKYIVSLKSVPAHVQDCNTDVPDVPRGILRKNTAQQRYARADTVVSAAVSGGESRDVGGDG